MTTKKKTGKSKGGAPRGNQNAVGNPGGGRPTDYQGEDTCRIAGKMAQLGATDKEIAEALGISLKTYHNWRTTHVEFSTALKMNKEVIDQAVERSLVQRALGYDYEVEELSMGKKIAVKKHMPPDIKAQHIWLRNRVREHYQETKTTEHKHTLSASMDKMLDLIEEEIKLERASRAKLIEHEPN